MADTKRIKHPGLTAAICILALAAVSAAVLWVLPALRGGADAKDWTVMVYMAGSDLEEHHGLAGRDLREMAAALRPGTRLLVMTDGVNDWADSPRDGVCRVWQLSGEEHVPLGSRAGGMGDPETLRYFLDLGLREAEGQTALILWDHGYGPMEGFGSGSGAEDGRLTLTEIAQALEAAGCGERPLSLIGFDACLMAGCETALTLRPWARWMLASQETEPPEGWDYGFLAELGPDTAPEDLGRAVIKAYAACYRKLYADYPDCRQPYSLSLTDLGETEALAEAVDVLFAALETDVKEDRYRAVSAARMGAWGFGRSTTNTEFDLIDLRSLAEACGDHPAEAGAVTAALDRCVTERAGSGTVANGLSVYFPQYGGKQDRNWDGSLAELPLPEGWKRFIRAYRDARLAAGPDYEHTAGTVCGGGRYAMELSAEEAADFVRAAYYLMTGDPEGELTVISGDGTYTLDGRTLSVPAPRRILTASNGEETYPLVSFWIQEDAGTAFYYSYALDMVKTGDTRTPVPIRIRIEQSASGGWEALSAFDLSGEMVTGRQELRLEDIDCLWIPVYGRVAVRGGDGRLLPWLRWENGAAAVEELQRGGGWVMGETPLSPEGGPYWLQIIVWDVYDRPYASELMPVELP